METNMAVTINEELYNKGKILIEAAYEFWKVHQKVAGLRAVVWLKDTSGHFVLFTRGEYLDNIMAQIKTLSEEIPLDDPFVEHTGEDGVVQGG